MEIDKVPEFLKVELSPPTKGAVSKTWDLKVTVPPDAVSGPMGPESAIYLKTKDQPPRRIRIPVSGTAAR